MEHDIKNVSYVLIHDLLNDAVSSSGYKASLNRC
jgi:hypothetical protein